MNINSFNKIQNYQNILKQTSFIQNPYQKQILQGNIVSNNFSNINKSVFNDFLNDIKSIKNSEINLNKSFNTRSINPDEKIVSNLKMDDKNINKLNINVKEIAKEQITTTKSFNSNDSNFNSGTYKFSLFSGDKNNEFSLNISKGESNKSVLSKINDTINNSNTGINSKLIENKKDNTFSLEISGKTNKYNKFIVDLKDVETKNTQESKQTIVNINDKEYISNDRNIEFNKNKMEVKSEGDIILQKERDNTIVKESTVKYVNELNKFIEKNNLKDFNKQTNLKEFAKIGIEFNKNEFRINEEKLVENIKENKNFEKEISNFMEKTNTLVNKEVRNNLYTLNNIENKQVLYGQNTKNISSSLFDMMV